MNNSNDGKDKKSGYRTPPLNSRFRKGESGNARGRPPKSGFQSVETILKRRVPMAVNGKERKVPLSEALVRATAQRAMDNDVHAIKEMWKLSEGIRLKQLARKPQRFPPIIRETFSPKECPAILQALGITGPNKWGKPGIEDWVKDAARRRNPRLA